jgi:hypothetical protein
VSNNDGGGLPGTLKAWLGVGVAAFALIAGWQAYEHGAFTSKKEHECHMSGTVVSTFSGSPAAGVRLGFAPADQSSTFEEVTRSRADGTFSSSCETARKRTTGSSFELLAEGTFGTGSLPCLTPEDTNITVDREGDSKDLSVQVRGC